MFITVKNCKSDLFVLIGQPINGIKAPLMEWRVA